MKLSINILLVLSATGTLSAVVEHQAPPPLQMDIGGRAPPPAGPDSSYPSPGAMGPGLKGPKWSGGRPPFPGVMGPPKGAKGPRDIKGRGPKAPKGPNGGGVVGLCVCGRGGTACGRAC